MIRRILLLNEQTFQSFQSYIRQHPSNADQADASAEFMCPQLALVVIHGTPMEGRIVIATREITMAAACQLHIYGSISPSDVVYACRYPPLLYSPDESDVDSDCSVASVAWSADDSVDVDVDLLVLHKNARLIMENCVYPTSVDVSFETSGRILDLRSLGVTEFMRETLNGSMWLLNEGETGCERSEENDMMSKTAKILCSWVMVQPVVETLRMPEVSDVSNHIWLCVKQRLPTLSFEMCLDAQYACVVPQMQTTRYDGIYETWRALSKFTITTSESRQRPAFGAGCFSIDGTGGIPLAI